MTAFGARGARAVRRHHHESAALPDGLVLTDAALHALNDRQFWCRLTVTFTVASQNVWG